MKPHPELKLFLNPYSPTIQDLTLAVRKFTLDLVRNTYELIWDNYNAVAMAYSKSDKLKDAFCHIAVYAHHINFGFNRGAELTKRDLKLNESGKLIRHLKITSIEDFKSADLKLMVYEAVRISEGRNNILKDSPMKPMSIVMSISEKKIRPKS